MSNFGERLKELMEDKGVNAPALAKILNVDRSTVTRYRNGERTPDYLIFIAILNYFNCSADYIMGLVDIPPDIEKFEDVKPFGTRLRFVIDYCKSSQYKLETEKGYSTSAVYNWLHGIKLPTINSLERLSNDLECSVDFLLGRIS